MNPILIEIGPGELVDRLTILRIREQHTSDLDQRARINRAIARLANLLDRSGFSSPALDSLMARMHVVNSRLWTIEDDIRACEARQDFGPHFILLARQVYMLNDERAGLKCTIDELGGWPASEVKTYRTDLVRCGKKASPLARSL